MQSGQMIKTSDLSGIAAAWKIGEDTREADQISRLFSTWEITRYMISVAPAHLRRVLRSHSDLPQGRTDQDRKARWFSYEEVQKLRDHFSRNGAHHKGYLPYRPNGLRAQVVCCAHTKRGIGRTTVAVHLAVAAALDGYRVLAIDLDAEGSLTSILGGNTRQETATTLIARHYCRHIQTENRHRVNRGEAPIPLNATLLEALSIDKATLVTRSKWSGIGLLSAGPSLAAADLRSGRWQLDTRSWRPWDWLRGEAQEGGLFDGYDLVVIDTPPTLGMLSVSGITASDQLVIPAGADAHAFSATARFIDLLHETLSELEAQENSMANALGNDPIRFSWEAVRTVRTKCEATRMGDMTVPGEAAGTLLPVRQDLTPLIGSGPGCARCIYDVDYRDFTRETYVTARRSFDETYTALKQIFTENWRRQEQLTS